MRMRVSTRVSEFNRIAARYDATYGAECDVLHRLALAEVAGVEPVPRSVLDIGCGTGALLELVARRWPEASLTGCDPAEEMSRLARSRLPAATIRTCPAEGLDVGDAEFDLVLSTTSFGQWADQVAGLREVARVLRPGGIGVVVEYRLPGLVRRLVYRMPDLATPEKMTRMVGAAGLAMRHQRVVDHRHLVTVVGRR